MTEEWQTGGLMECFQEWSEGYITKFAQEYKKGCNKECNQILKKERMGRGVSQDKLSKGLLSRATLRDLEEGQIGWSKTMGDMLMHRMGISTDYFETVVFSKELERWRSREDICRLVPEKPQDAKDRIQEYRQKYQKRETFEEQFLLKAEVILMISCGNSWNEDLFGGAEGSGSDELLKMAERAAACTIPTDWENGLEKLWLAPSELEALLLVGGVQALRGEVDAAWKLQQEVWEYPGMRQWKERMEVLIKPQAAVLGIELALRRKDVDAAYKMGQEALELLRRNQSQRYLLPLLDSLGNIPIQDEKSAEYLKQAAKFAQTFRRIYEMYDCPGYRMWQSIDMNRTREMGVSLEMLRMFHGKSRAKAIIDKEGQIVTQRHLAKIEQGIHRPSTENYRRLIKQYGKYEGWGVTILETDSVEVLELRQQISDLIGFGKWEEAEWEIRRFRRMVDTRYPKVKQELLLWEALLKKKKDHALEESLKMLFKALNCTIPEMNEKNMGNWGFRQEEIVIVGNIAILCHKLGKLDEAKAWFEAVLCSMKKQEDRTGVKCTGYDMIICAYENLLADMGVQEKALQAEDAAVRVSLESSQIRCLPTMFYRIAWNSYEISSGDIEMQKRFRPKWREAYRISEVIDDYIYDDRHKAFLNVGSRREKFLHVEE